MLCTITRGTLTTAGDPGHEARPKTAKGNWLHFYQQVRVWCAPLTHSSALPALVSAAVT
jgi:hypothetical protein